VANAADLHAASGTSKLIGDWLMVRMCGGDASPVLAVVAIFRGDAILPCRERRVDVASSSSPGVLEFGGPAC
jgi:hypothetical protein